MWQSVLKDVESKMEKTVGSMTHEFATVRTGRATPMMFETLKVDYYGTPTPIKQLANISIPEPRMVIIQPWDAGSVKEIEKAILASSLSLQPSVEGKVIRISIPALSAERREEMARVVKKMAEDGRVALRSIRRDGNDRIKQLEKESSITEDDCKKALDKIQQLTDRCTKRIDELASSKEKDLVTV